MSVRLDGLTVIAGAGVGQAEAARPVFVTVTFAEVDPSETITVPPGVAVDGFARRMVTMLPLTVAVMPVLVEAVLYAPEPPDTATWTLVLQSVSVTEDGFTATGVPGLGVGQTPVAAPVALTVTLVVEVPSEIVTVPPENAPEGLVRRTERTEPLTLAVMLPLEAAAL